MQLVGLQRYMLSLRNKDHTLSINCAERLRYIELQEADFLTEVRNLKLIVHVVLMINLNKIHSLKYCKWSCRVAYILYLS